jgi:hypothetical protein
LPLLAARTHPVTASPVTAEPRVHRSQRRSAALPNMQPRHAQGEKTMFDDAAMMIRVLAGCVLGGCFAVAVILNAAVG